MISDLFIPRREFNKKITVQELIEGLQAIEDKSLPVSICTYKERKGRKQLVPIDSGYIQPELIHCHEPNELYDIDPRIDEGELSHIELTSIVGKLL